MTTKRPCHRREVRKGCNSFGRTNMLSPTFTIHWTCKFGRRESRQVSCWLHIGVPLMQSQERVRWCTCMCGAISLADVHGCTSRWYILHNPAVTQMHFLGESSSVYVHHIELHDVAIFLSGVWMQRHRDTHATRTMHCERAVSAPLRYSLVHTWYSPVPTQHLHKPFGRKLAGAVSLLGRLLAAVPVPLACQCCTHRNAWPMIRERNAWATSNNHEQLSFQASSRALVMMRDAASGAHEEAEAGVSFGPHVAHGAPA